MTTRVNKEISRLFPSQKTLKTTKKKLEKGYEPLQLKSGSPTSFAEWNLEVVSPTLLPKQKNCAETSRHKTSNRFKTKSNTKAVDSSETESS